MRGPCLRAFCVLPVLRLCMQAGTGLGRPPADERERVIYIYIYYLDDTGHRNRTAAARGAAPRRSSIGMLGLYMCIVYVYQCIYYIYKTCDF
jgi:hypothetical protein